MNRLIREKIVYFLTIAIVHKNKTRQAFLQYRLSGLVCIGATVLSFFILINVDRWTVEIACVLAFRLARYSRAVHSTAGLTQKHTR